jgi:hypothetical protein
MEMKIINKWTKLRVFFITCVFLFFVLNVISQDRLYSNFLGNESAFNPSLSGFRGAFSISGRFVSQWQSPQLNAYRTGLFKMEESLPCSIFDYDLHAEYNEEGSGIYKTMRLGGNIAGTAPFETGKSTVHNIRFGIGLAWQFNAINFNQLVFSDQLDPKYGAFDAFGNLNQSSFIAPLNNRTKWLMGAKPNALLDHIPPNNGDITKPITIKDKVIIAKALRTDISAISRRDISILDLPFPKLKILRVAMAKVLVLIPPPVDCGEAPIHIKSSTNRMVGKLMAALSMVLKPAVLGVVAPNKAVIIFNIKENASFS